MRRAMSIGRLRTRPPSTRGWPCTSIGANAPGTDIDARIAVDSDTSFCRITRLPLARLVAIAANGIGRRARSLMSSTGPPSACSIRNRFCVLTMPRGSDGPSRLNPNSKENRFL